jgi:hypothetical protein
MYKLVFGYGDCEFSSDVEIIFSNLEDAEQAMKAIDLGDNILYCEVEDV